MISSLTINGLTIGQSSANYTLREAQGFGTADVEVVRFERPGFHGSKVPRAYFRARIMRLRVGIKSSTVADYASKRRALLKALDLPRDGLSTMTFTTSEPLSLQCNVQLAGAVEAPLLAGEVTMGEVWIPLIAPDPLFYSQTETETDITFAVGTGIINNTGDAPIFPTIRAYGNLESSAGIIIENNTAGKTVSFTGLSLDDAEYMNIDMENETIIKNDTSSLYSYIDSDDFWWLGEGNNIINISANTGGGGNRKITITYRLGYLGI
jgi:hypothetical protein